MRTFSVQSQGEKESGVPSKKGGRGRREGGRKKAQTHRGNNVPIQITTVSKKKGVRKESKGGRGRDYLPRPGRYRRVKLKEEERECWVSSRSHRHHRFESTKGEKGKKRMDSASTGGAKGRNNTFPQERKGGFERRGSEEKTKKKGTGNYERS